MKCVYVVAAAYLQEFRIPVSQVVHDYGLHRLDASGYQHYTVSRVSLL